MLEGFVLAELARQLTWSEELAELYHYRDHNKVEVVGIVLYTGSATLPPGLRAVPVSALWQLGNPAVQR